MKLSAYAKHVGVSYRTAFRWFKSGTIQGRPMDTGTLLMTESVETPDASAAIPSKVVLYTRVSAAENKAHRDGQAQRLQDYGAAKGDPVAQGVKEIGSGVNDARPKWLKLLTDPTLTVIGVEHKDRLTRFGFHSIEPWLKRQDRRIEVINLTENGKEELVQDLVSLIPSFGARLYGPRRSKRQTERRIAELMQDPSKD